MATADEHGQAQAQAPAPAAPNRRTSANEGRQGSNQRRRGQHQQAQEFIDELAQETKRVTLLEREEQQLAGKKHVSRLLFAFGIADEKKMQTQVDNEFTQWRDKLEDGTELTGVLLFLGQVAVCFLEGPTDQLFKALEVFHALTQEILPAPASPAAPPEVRSVQSTRSESVEQAAPRPALIGAVRIFYFTEMHGVRTSTGWCSFANATKQGGAGNASLEDGTQETVFLLYKKLLMLCLKVRDEAGDKADGEKLQSYYRNHADMMPLPEEVTLLLGKLAAEYLFSFVEFQKLFMKPFQLVLNSELLWPMPPALSY
jgi:hypothetical protein